MQKLLAFIVAKRHWFLFFLFETVSFVLIYRNNAYQQNIMLSSANAITGRLLLASGNIFSYFELQKVNQELHEQNRRLEMEVIRLHEQLNIQTTDTTSFSHVFLHDRVLTDSLVKRNYRYQLITASVTNNSINYLHN